MTDRELMQMALDVLENHTDVKHPQQIGYRNITVSALRERLAQPEPEPVGWGNKKGEFKIHQAADDAFRSNAKPFYSSPKREWIGLTDEEYETLKSACHLDDVGFDMSIQRLCLAIEAKLKEKNS